MGPGFRIRTAWLAVLFCNAGRGQSVPAVPYIYTQAPRYDPEATLTGGERFPAGAVLQLVSNGKKRELAPGFAASADAAVSFDGRRALFSGKRKPSDPWQVWETALNGGASRHIQTGAEDSIAPFYLPEGRIVYARRTPTGFQLMSVASSGGESVQLTYGPSNHIASEVLHDGRILFEAPHPGGSTAARDLFTVYPDGTGVETYRCDHGRDRHAAKEVSSGDVVFETAGRLARFTSARAVQTELPQPKGEFAGPVAEISAGEWLVSYRADPQAPYGLYRWSRSPAPPEKIAETDSAQALQPVLVRPHPVPNRFPSALLERPGANLLCLNVFASRLPLAGGSVSAVRVWALDDRGSPVVLGQAPVERDGSFYVQAPGERAIRFDLLDRLGKTVAAEKGWFWARRGEQRVCVGCHAGPERAPENAVPETLLRSTEPVELALRSHGAPARSSSEPAAAVLPTPAPSGPGVQSLRYPSPIELAVSGDGARLYAVCQGTDEVVAYDLRTLAILRRIPVGRQPKGIALSADSRRIYVANSWSDTVSEIDASSFEVLRTLPAGWEPTSVTPDREGRFLYVANRIGGDISVVDLASGSEAKRLAAAPGASYLALSPDGSRMYGTHIYPIPGKFRTPPESEITVIDAARQMVSERYRLHNAAGVFHVAVSPDGRLGMAAQLHPKNLAPLAHVEHGWVFGNSISLFGEDVGDVVQIPIDELDHYFTPPFGIAVAPDKSAAYVSTTGSDSVTVIDIRRLLEFVRSKSPAERRALANDLSASANYVAARIPVGSGPKGIALSPDGMRLYVANRTGDTISIIDTARRRVSGTLSLGGPATLTSQRRGERLFYSARFAFQGHFGCANCHLEATMDGLSWDLEPDGFGKDIVDNRLLEWVEGTEPFKWNGGNPDLETECGPRTEMFFYRSQSYNGAELADLVSFVRSIPPRPNRFRLANGELTPAQERGKAIFARTRKKDGTSILEFNQCPVCHSGPHYTNRQLADVGSGKPTDRSPMIDVPQLTNIALSAPYLHDGSARTLEEIWTVFNPKDTHGVTNDLQKDELNDLIEYLKTL